MGTGDLFRGLYGQSRGRANARNGGGGGLFVLFAVSFPHDTITPKVTGNIRTDSKITTSGREISRLS